MKKKRPRRKSPKPPPAGRPSGEGRRQGPLQYKVVELSTVDEASLEAVLNDWARRGWKLDGIQFAMRESSKRPAMAFVLFTKEGEADVAEPHPFTPSVAERSRGGTPETPSTRSAYERLQQLAGEGDE